LGLDFLAEIVYYLYVTKCPTGTQQLLPFFPPNSTQLSDQLAFAHEDGRLVFFGRSGPIFSCPDTDKYRIRLASAMLTRELDLCSPAAMARAIGVHRGSVHRNAKKLADGGAEALRRQRRPGPRRAHKLTDDKLPHAQELLSEGKSLRDVGEALGVVAGTIDNAIKAGRLHRTAKPSRRRRASAPELVGPREQGAAATASEAVHGHDAAAPEPVALREPTVQDAAAAADVAVRVTDTAEPERVVLREPSVQDAAAAADVAVRATDTTEPELVGPRERSEQDAAAAAGVAVHRHEERTLAAFGKLAEATPVFEAAEAVQYGGVLLALPALQQQGLIDEGLKTYKSLRNGFFGLRSVLLVMAFIALLRIRTFEQLSKALPGELGRVLGLDRAPEVKTLRRKLEELAERQLASEFASALTRRWAAGDPEVLGLLYVDGHVRAYNGQKHSLPKRFVQRRRMCMPGTTDVWVNDARTDPLFFVTAPANDGLLTMLEGYILPNVRELVGPERRVTMVFDREGWSPKSFAKWSNERFDVLTYRKGKYEDWPEAQFAPHKVQVSGNEVTYLLAERELQLTKSFAMREVRRLCDDGHQTSIVTTRRDLALPVVALKMFSRWGQENYFRYMREEFALDHMPTYDAEAADAERTVPNPDLAPLKNELKALRAKLAKAEQEYGAAAIENPEQVRPSMRGFKIAHGKLGQEIRTLRTGCAELKATLKSLPDRVPLKDIKKQSEIVKLETERKVLTDQVKMIAYRAESELYRMLTPLLQRCDDEGRAFLASVFRAPADLIPDLDAGTLTVRILCRATPRDNAALRALCDLATDQRTTFPGTKLRMVFEGP
jgi:transposase